MPFFSFEGGEGCGKTSQARLLRNRLLQADCPAMLVREPGGTPLGNALRRWLKSGRPLSLQAELFLFLAARAELVSQVLRPALDRDDIIICDRFADSTIAYQGYGRGMEPRLLQTLNVIATGGLTPRLTFLLDIDPAVGLQRKSKSRDCFESAGMEFHTRVREGYLTLAHREPGRWVTLDGTRGKQDLADEIWSTVRPLLSTRSLHLTQ